MQWGYEVCNSGHKIRQQRRRKSFPALHLHGVICGGMRRLWLGVDGAKVRLGCSFYIINILVWYEVLVIPGEREVLTMGKAKGEGNATVSRKSWWQLLPMVEPPNLSHGTVNSPT
ncbi:hypothetical protein V6Z11_A05G083300 [Gossypium hirsutum]